MRQVLFLIVVLVGVYSAIRSLPAEKRVSLVQFIRKHGPWVALIIAAVLAASALVFYLPVPALMN